MYAIASLLLVVAVSLLITRVAAAVLTATGLSAPSARFQARSAFTGAGFTTSESERVVDHPVRRQVVSVLMLAGNAGIVASASTLILGFQRLSHGAPGAGFRILLLVAGVIALVVVSRNRWIDRHLTRLIRHVLSRYTALPTRDLAGLLELSGTYAVSELAIGEADWVAGHRLGDLGLREEGVAVLGVTRGGQYRGDPVGATRLLAGDILVVYGREEVLGELDHRPAGPAGDARHAAAVDRQARLVAEAELPDQPDHA